MIVTGRRYFWMAERSYFWVAVLRPNPAAVPSTLVPHLPGLAARRSWANATKNRRDSRTGFFVSGYWEVEEQVLDANGSSAFSFSTSAIPAKQREAYWRKSFGRQIVRVDFAPDSDVPLEATCRLRAMPGLRTILRHCKCLPPVCRARGPCLPTTITRWGS